LGLALVAFTAPQETALREGCQLVPDTDHPAVWQLVRHDGHRADKHIDHSDALKYAKAVATAFVVGESKTPVFNIKEARAQLSKSKDERKAAKKTAK
jgi:CRISPR-associated protein Csb1